MTAITVTNSVASAFQLYVRTNTSRQIRYRLSGSDGSAIMRISAHGWLDRRGRNV